MTTTMTMTRVTTTTNTVTTGMAAFLTSRDVSTTSPAPLVCLTDFESSRQLSTDTAGMASGIPTITITGASEVLLLRTGSAGVAMIKGPDIMAAMLS